MALITTGDFGTEQEFVNDDRYMLWIGSEAPLFHILQAIAYEHTVPGERDSIHDLAAVIELRLNHDGSFDPRLPGELRIGHVLEIEHFHVSVCDQNVNR